MILDVRAPLKQTRKKNKNRVEDDWVGQIPFPALSERVLSLSECFESENFRTHILLISIQTSVNDSWGMNDSRFVMMKNMLLSVLTVCFLILCC